MITKVEAAEIAMQDGIYTVIADGNDYNTIDNIMSGKPTGTVFCPRLPKLLNKTQEE